MVQTTKEFNGILGFVWILSIISYILIMLYGSARSKLGFNYDISNMDDLALNGYFRQKLTMFQKIKFLFTGDSESTLVNQRSELMNISGGFDENIPGDDSNNIFENQDEKKKDFGCNEL